ncbi:MAG: hypothetical protein IRZ03_14495 [Acidobacterium ailaaui]|nr:hypothetical protein [Pseudacidobacterium ailaaui]
MSVDHIQYTDTLRKGTDKINAAIDQSNEAFETAALADAKATNALTNTQSLQEQINQLVIEGDSSVEAAQARVNADGVAFQTLKDRLDDSDARLAEVTDLARFEPNGQQSLTLKESLYIKNDKNLFGYNSDGSSSSIASIEQNDIIKFGDFKNIAWIAAKDYVAIKAPAMSLTEQVDANGNNITPPRTIYHQGNFCNHAILYCTTGTQNLTKNSVNLISILDTTISAFPSYNVTNNSYIIPRKGVYVINITAKITTTVTATSGLMRFGIRRNSGGTVTDIDINDQSYSSTAYGTPFLGTTFIYRFNQEDIVSPYLKPLNENITIGLGTKFNIYFLGDDPTA